MDVGPMCVFPGAVVAREYGIPCLAGARGALNMLKQVKTKPLAEIDILIKHDCLHWFM